MNRQSRLDYHRQRARQEFDLGASTSCASASRAHIALAMLHQRCAEEILADPFPVAGQDASEAVSGSTDASQPAFVILGPTASRSNS